ncbi:hypothetical protein PHJA_001375600 [Phtheirospermum japonicum]|uniref:Bifunctional inhibitor/plant lipid transfer protein/seed storage helical domain-containing protein n=1 Tax=Phtheirospermum japonicum TaxID=374723 RepID=A0A830CAZ7_9LAMI|nr:hypothetical protein PHJA_001375600 [Phtheirospermum japonicum]
MSLKMSDTSLIISLVLVMLWNKGTAQSGCTMALASLSPCLNYIRGNSSTPSSSCCSRLSNVVQSNPQCLCALLKGGASNFGIAVNQTLALALPGACDVQTPPVSQCDGVNNGPPNSGPAPADAPADEIPEDPNTSSDTDINPSDAGIGSKTVPGSDGSFVVGSNNNKNGGNAKFSIFGLVASSWAIIYGTRF